jgi:hypothetical protein
MSTITEGMRPNDLEDLILPMITIDEFESKVDENAVVVGFYVNDKDGANDLNRFIQKSALKILDTDVSPAPDQHGYYLVFVEFLNDSNISENINSLVEEIVPLSGNDKWQMSMRGIDGITNFSAKTVKKHFQAIRDRNNKKNVIEFFKNSDLTNVIVENDVLILEGYRNKFNGKILSIGSEMEIFVSFNLLESALQLDLETSAEYMRISRFLGEGWLASRFGSTTLLKQENSDVVLLLGDANFT